MVKLPPYAIEFQITLDGVKRYSGWTDAELAKKLGVSERTLGNLRSDPCAASGGLILRVQYMLLEYRKKAGVIG